MLWTYQYFSFESVHGEAMLKMRWVVKKWIFSFWKAINWSKCILMISVYIWLSIYTNNAILCIIWKFDLSSRGVLGRIYALSIEVLYILLIQNIIFTRLHNPSRLQLNRMNMRVFKSTCFIFGKSSEAMFNASSNQVLLTVCVHLMFLLWVYSISTLLFANSTFKEFCLRPLELKTSSHRSSYSAGSKAMLLRIAEPTHRRFKIITVIRLSLVWTVDLFCR